jgi:tetrahydromethanopterin S-methyltransferase subunit A
MAKSLAARSEGPAQPFTSRANVRSLQGFVPERMTSDPAGYFVVYVDRTRRLLSLEHYANTGVLNTIVEGRSAAELYFPVIEQKLLTRLDHAAYLGRELAKAERSLATGEPYVQDAAPERPRSSASASSCGCGSSCSGEGGGP